MNDWLDAEQHVERAHELYDLGRWDEAESELRQALSLNPYQAEWHFNLGLTLEAAGRNAEAARAFADAFGLSSEDANPAMLAGANFVRAGEPERGLEWLDRAMAIEPRKVEIAVQKIDALGELGRHDEAEEVFYLALEHDSDHAELYTAMAESLLDRKMHDKAMWCLREAARLDPGLPRVQARLAEAYAATGRLERARQLYLRELRQDPGDVETLLDLGALLVDMHRYTEAGEKFRRVLELEPDNPDAHFSLGDLAERVGDAGEAATQFDVVVRLDSEYPAARRRLAGLLIDRGREKDEKRIRDLLSTELSRFRTERGRFEADDLTDLGGLLLDADLPAEAVRVYRRVLELRPGDHLAHHHLSVALFETGDVKGGMEAARRALVFQPRFVPAMYNLALSHLRQGQWLRARYWVRQATRIDPDDAPMRRLRMTLRLRSAWSVCVWVGRSATAATVRGWWLLTRPRRVG